MNQDGKTAPTEEQVKAANEAEAARWEGDFKDEDLVIPYKREVSTDEVAAADETSTNGTATDTEEVDDYTAPTPVTTVNDPGDYKPADYSFEVTLKDGKSVKVATTEEAEKIADDPDNFETPKQLMDFINKQNKMNRNLDRDREKWEAQKKAYDEQQEAEKQRYETVNSYVGEFQYLVNKGLMPAVDKKYETADWSDPEVAKQPGVKEQLALLNYMTKENAARTKAGVKPITSIVDAFNAWQMDSGRQQAEAKKKAKEEADRAAIQARKTASARVASVSAGQQGVYAPKGIAVGNPRALDQNVSVWDN